MYKLISTFFTALLFFFPAPSFCQSFDITKFGAKEESNINNAVAIQKAIDKCTIKGGVVLVPPGKFYTGTIILKSNVSLN